MCSLSLVIKYFREAVLRSRRQLSPPPLVSHWRSVTPIVLYTNVNAQCDKPATVVGRATLTALVAKIISSMFGREFSGENSLIFEIPEFTPNVV